MAGQDHRIARLFVCFLLATVWLTALLAGGPTAELDGALSASMRPPAQGWIAQAAFAITWLGDWLVLVPLAVASAAYLVWQQRCVEAFSLLATVAAVRVLVELQKAWLGRPRPNVDQWMVEYSASFPSAHAANSLATFLAIAILLPKSRTARRTLVGVALACSALVGASRIVLGVHWPSDVIGGWAFALIATSPLWSSLRSAPKSVISA